MRNIFVVLAFLLSAPTAAAEECYDLFEQEKYSSVFSACKELAEQGDAAAQTNLGYVYAEGEGVLQDYNEALKWFRLAATQKYARAQYNIAVSYYFGHGVRQDIQEAIKWVRLAATQGYARAQFNLGNSYNHGRGVRQDYQEAIKWYGLAAAQGDVKAQAGLGFIYAEGNGVAQDYKEAAKWFRLAAEQGHVNAQFNLGISYGKGEGVLQDYKEAYIWFALAAVSSGLDHIKKNRDWAKNQLTASELRQAKKEAKRRLQAIESRGAAAAVSPPPKPRSSELNSAEIAYENGWRSVVVVKTSEAQGSGVIIRPNLVATNCHVVEDGSDIVVYKADNRRAQVDTAHNATIRHSDVSRDLCLLDVVGLWGIPANVRSADSLSVGESVYAIGSPRGLDYSLSAGIVSQLRGDDVQFIQTDAAISPGSSGGGLFDGEGNLVGITTSKFVEEDTEGITFAIPADWVFDLQ